MYKYNLNNNGLNFYAFIVLLYSFLSVMQCCKSNIYIYIPYYIISKYSLYMFHKIKGMLAISWLKNEIRVSFQQEEK